MTQMNLSTKQKHTDIQNNLWLPKAGVEEGRSRSLNLAKKWINKKVLLYSTGNYIQFHVTNHNGKNIKKKV